MYISVTTQDYIQACDEPDCLLSLTCKNPVMAPIFEFVHHNAVRIEKVCRDLNVAFMLDLPTCHFRKQKDIIYNIEQACVQQEGCMKVVAKCIEDGFIPLNDDNHSVSWDKLNLYRNLDAANTIIPVITDDMFPPTEEQIANYNRQQKQEYKIKQELGYPGLPEPKVTLKSRPTVLDIQTALSTFRMITQGKTYKSMFGVLNSCRIKNSDRGLNRQVSLVPFIARFDPWIEFMGYIADSENVVD